MYIQSSAKRNSGLKSLVIILLILAAAGGYLYLHPEVWQKWVKDTPLEPPPTVTHLYKWRDDNGQWQVTDRPPPPGIEYEKLIYHSDTNVMPLVPKDENN